MTVTATLQLDDAGIVAPESETLFAVVTTDPPVHVVEAFGIAAFTNPAG